VLEGVVAGVRDYGNRMGIPTVNGAVCVHPGYLVDDPDDFHETLGTPVGGRTQTLSSWLRVGASLFRHDPVVSETLSRLAAHPERRKALRLLHAMLGMPVLMDRLLQTLEVKRR
jgi:hypothetical protein